MLPASQYDLLQPRFKEQAPPMATRDRFRSRSKSGVAYDDVEDDYNYNGGQELELELDSFDERLMQQSYPDRRGQAELGRARLSFAPGEGHGARVRAYESERYAPEQAYRTAYEPPELRTEQMYRPDHGLERSLPLHPNHRDEEPGPELSFRGRLSQFALNSSSDPQISASSSPALKAGLRRAEHHAGSLLHEAPQARSGQRYIFHEQDQVQQYDDSVNKPQYQDQTMRDATQQESVDVNDQSHHAMFRSNTQQAPKPATKRHVPAGPPTCQGIQLVSISNLPDRLRTVFPYPLFNAVQSKCFDQVFKSDDNFVLASPTGSGKTVILELAICRAIVMNATGQYKVIYQAPTKALCAERQRDWAAKFTPLGLKCCELTGDSDAADLRNVQSANIIITTPEKWDSITRKWTDHERLMRLIRVFLIDEVHILKEDRGAVLEAVVSRMKSISTHVRFVALSATVPNFHDVASWLGKNASEPYTTAPYQKFGEEFRPVKLQKNVRGYGGSTNDFGFDKILDAKLPSVIMDFSAGKPIMVFCATRNSCLSTAKLLANWWRTQSGRERFWTSPSKSIAATNKDLRETILSGVAFHHAGLALEDRSAVEHGFLNRDISVICCTSTLAVGVNLPCHLVIIKNTMAYTDEGLQEYSDLEMMQMLGRAGRPQHDDSAVAVIMTRQTKVQRYQTMTSGQEALESKLHLNLIAHMNAEIGLGTIRDALSARKWLTGTFLYIRMQQNPTHYKLGGVRTDQNINEQVDDICSRDIDLLREFSLVSGEGHFRCTEYGHAMARYYVQFDTMKVFIGLQSKATVSEILSAIAQATEFSTIRFRSGEKSLYRLLNKSPSIRFAIPVNLDLPAHKVSLIIQSVLGCAEVSWDGEIAKYKNQHVIDTQIVFKYINSLIRCIIDCQITAGDSTSIQNALLIERSLGARAWDDSPLQMRQIEGIGVVAVRKFVNAGIRSMEDLEGSDAHRIEALIGRNPPFGMRVLEAAHDFPKLRVSLYVQSTSAKQVPDGVTVQVKADVGFINERPPHHFAGKVLYVCILVETSDGRKIHFARTSGLKMGPGQSLVFPALLTAPDQCINCYVMCDSIAGSMRGATIKPQVPASFFPLPKAAEPEIQQQPNTSRRRTETTHPAPKPSTTSDDFGDDGIDDEALVTASFSDLDFDHIDKYRDPAAVITRKNTVKNKSAGKPANSVTKSANSANYDQEPVQLLNGKWACSHKCKDKTACKHLCCKEGMDKPSRKTVDTKGKSKDIDQPQGSQSPASTQPRKEVQTKLQVTSSKRKTSANIEELDLTQQEKKSKPAPVSQRPKEYRELQQLHRSTQGQKDLPRKIHTVMSTKPAYCYSQGGEHNLSFMIQGNQDIQAASSDYGDVQFDEASSHVNHLMASCEERLPESVTQYFEDEVDDVDPVQPANHGSETFGDDDSVLGAAMVGIADSQWLIKDELCGEGKSARVLEDFELDFDANDAIGDYSEDINQSFPALQREATGRHENGDKDMTQTPRHAQKQKKPGPFVLNTSSLGTQGYDSTLVSHAGNTVTDDQLKRPHIKVGLLAESVDEFDPEDEENMQQVLDMLDVEPAVPERAMPDAFKDLDPWVFQEYGDVVELLDD